MIGVLAVMGTSLLASGVLLQLLVRLLPDDFLLAAVNARSNHSRPTRQIGGLAVVPAAVGGLLVACFFVDGADRPFLMAVAAGAVLLMVLGYVDDRRELAVAPRLAGQVAAALLLVATMGPEFRVLPDSVPRILEQALIMLMLVWFINLTNFMDGLDLMLVAGVGLPHAVLALFGLFTGGHSASMVSAAIGGGLMGFAPHNRHPARVFLGDSGSLPAGFLTGAAILLVARHHPLPALLPFLYFFADSTSVLVMRFMKGENLLEAHSAHAYQIARRSGRGSGWIARQVALVSLLCTFLALAAIVSYSEATMAFSLAAAVLATMAVIARLRGAF